jgi:hypothetical protein
MTSWESPDLGGRGRVRCTRRRPRASRRCSRPRCRGGSKPDQKHDSFRSIGVGSKSWATRDRSRPANIPISRRRNWRPCLQREVPMRRNACRRTLSSRAGEGKRVRGEQSGRADLPKLVLDDVERLPRDESDVVVLGVVPADNQRNASRKMTSYRHRRAQAEVVVRNSPRKEHRMGVVPIVSLHLCRSRP